MSSIDDLLIVAKLYAQAERISLATTSWRALGDTKKLPDIEAGSDIQVRRFEKTMQWFSDHWPNSASWPTTIDRPASTISQAGAA